MGLSRDRLRPVAPKQAIVPSIDSCPYPIAAERSRGDWGPPEPAHPGRDQLGELEPRERDGVVVAEARENVHALRLWGGVEERPALRERHDVVTVAVEDHERSVQLVDAAQGRVGIGNEGPRDEWVVQTAELADAGE